MTTRVLPGPRERLLEAAKELTYEQGVGVGVDALLKAANVARRSLYEHFGGKDGLITEVLRLSAAEDEAAYERIMEAAGDDPRRRLLAVFDWLGEVIEEPGFRGCRYLAAELALADPDHPGHEVTRRYHDRIRGLLESELHDLGHARPAHAAAQLLVLVNGVLAVGAGRSGADPAAAARELAERLLDDGRG